MFQPEKVERDKYGFWLHSVLMAQGEEKRIDELPEAEGMEFRFVAFEFDAPEELLDRYGEQDSPDVSYWNPTPPEGEGWFLLGIYDTEDLPYACFARPKETSDAVQIR